MLHTSSFNELSYNYILADEESFEEEEEEEEDNYIRGPTDINPKICSHCRKYPLEVRKYYKKDVENNVLHCENCGYLCIICQGFLPSPSKRSRKTVLMCLNGHSV